MLLPGLRELRAPLAAGYAWLLAAWIALSKHIPETQDEAEGVVLALYRLNEALSGFGLAAAATFVAYLLGSLSATLCSPLLRRLFRRNTQFADQATSSEPLSATGLDALEQQARETRERMDDALALSGTRTEELVDATEARRRAAARAAARGGKAKGGAARLGDVMLGGAPGPSRDEALEGRLTRLAIADLDALPRTRLLGKDADLYSAIDRHRAEVEFRLAVMPPLLALGVAFIVFGWEDWQRWIVPIAATLTVWGVVGLLWDARKRETEANDMLAEAIADRRVRSPTLERLETEATAIANRPEAEAMRVAASEFAGPLREALEMAEGSLSDLTRADRAAKAFAAAEERADKLSEYFTPRIGRAAGEALGPLREALSIWQDTLYQRAEIPDWGGRVTTLAKDARAAEATFRNAVLAELSHSRAPESEERPIDAAATAAQAHGV